MMSRLILFAIFLFSISPKTGFSQTAESMNSLYGNLAFDEPLLYAHLIFRGTVVDNWTDEATFLDWGIEAGGDRKFGIVLVQCTVEEVLKGHYTEPDIILASATGMDKHFHNGKEVIVCARFNTHSGQYAVMNARSVFVRDNNLWVRQTSRDRTVFPEALSLESVTNLVDRTRIPSITNEAELIIFGEVISKKRTHSIVEDGKSGMLDEFTLRVDAVLKGDESPGSEVQFGTITGGSYSPYWRTYIPSDLRIGEKWYVFLKRGPMGYYPFAGANGMILFDGGALVYDRSVTLPYAKDTFEKAIRVEAQNAR
jgi:hypothetical protein